jgi:hypothetical protein
LEEFSVDHGKHTDWRARVKVKLKKLAKGLSSKPICGFQGSEVSAHPGLGLEAIPTRQG